MFRPHLFIFMFRYPWVIKVKKKRNKLFLIHLFLKSNVNPKTSKSMSNITASTLTHSISDNDLDQVAQQNLAKNVEDQDVSQYTFKKL